MLNFRSLLFLLLSQSSVSMAASWIVESYENAPGGTPLVNYPSDIGNYSYSTSQGDGYAAISEDCSSSGNCAIIAGPYNTGGAFGFLEIKLKPEGRKFVRFSYDGSNNIFDSSLVSISGKTSSHTINLFYTNGWTEIAYEHDEPIERIIFLVRDHSSIRIDEISLGFCKNCR